MKPYHIPKAVVLQAYRHIRANKGTYGVDGVSLKEFERDLRNNLYKLWNRMSSGSYMPSAVKRVDIPKKGGKTRPLGIPTVADRVAQMVAKQYLEPSCELLFHDSSYGYRPGRNAHMAVEQARRNCLRYAWVIDLDIQSFFDTINHTLLMKAVRRHTRERWVLLYIERWLKAPVQMPDGTLQARTVGSPQGSVISPLLANLFLHYVFDKWMDKNVPYCPFERYADDIVVHCSSLMQANHVKEQITRRLAACGLRVHPDKTRVVYCKYGASKRQGAGHAELTFDFLSFTFKPRKCRTENTRLCTWWTYGPAISDKAKKRLADEIRSWRIGRRTGSTLEDFAHEVNPVLRGWLNYFGKFRRSELTAVLNIFNNQLSSWARRKYRRFGGGYTGAAQWLNTIKHQHPAMFVHWATGE